jgi:hypothetical protein
MTIKMERLLLGMKKEKRDTFKKDLQSSSLYRLMMLGWINYWMKISLTLLEVSHLSQLIHMMSLIRVWHKKWERMNQLH